MDDGTQNLDGFTLYDPLTGEYREDRRFERNAHPVTAIAVDPESGIIVLERHGADPVPVSPGSPALSRREILKRCDALLMAAQRKIDKARDPAFARLEHKLPLSGFGIGITYEELRVQTYMAVLRSREIEERIVAKANRKYGNSRCSL